MKNLFSIGELSKLQHISHQTLIYYDKIGLFKPSYTDPTNGYRYYSVNQLDYLDTITIMKKIGLSLEEIKSLLHDNTMEKTIEVLNRQQRSIDQQIDELKMIRERIIHRSNQLENALTIRNHGMTINIEHIDQQAVLTQVVKPPYTLEMVSIATKACFVHAFTNHLPIYFQSGVIVPYQNIQHKQYTFASVAYLPIEMGIDDPSIMVLPKGKCVIGYHHGSYPTIGTTYDKIITYCDTNHLKIISDAYEFAINDYLSSSNEADYITKIMFYIE